MIDFKDAGQLNAVIEELTQDIRIIEKAVVITKRDQDTVNHSVYRGRLEAYEGVLGLLKASKTNYEYELRSIKK